jgi:hypothetical protein
MKLLFVQFSPSPCYLLSPLGQNILSITSSGTPLHNCYNIFLFLDNFENTVPRFLNVVCIRTTYSSLDEELILKIYL